MQYSLKYASQSGLKKMKIIGIIFYLTSFISRQCSCTHLYRYTKKMKNMHRLMRACMRRLMISVIIDNIIRGIINFLYI